MLVITNAKVFDGRELLPGTHSVTLDGNTIAAIDDASTCRRREVLDAAGMTLMPGLITSHLHSDFYKFNIADSDRLGKERPPGVLMAIGVRTCRVLLESGFTGYSGRLVFELHRRATQDGHR